jgi:biopolymer transport protein TolQ
VGAFFFEGERKMEPIAAAAAGLDIVGLFSHATLVVKIVLAVLVCMSLGSWALMIQKWVALRSAYNKAADGLTRFERSNSLREAVQSMGSDPASPLYFVAHQGVVEFNRAKEVGTSSDVVVDNVRRSLRQGVGTELARLHHSLSLLATTANTAPFIGLFGTVWGIMHSFHAIGQLKSASLAIVAPGISEALVATAIGLGVAVPATIGYNMFLGKLNEVETQLVNFAGVFLNSVQRELNAHRPIQRSGHTEG